MGVTGGVGGGVPAVGLGGNVSIGVDSGVGVGIGVGEGVGVGAGGYGTYSPGVVSLATMSVNHIS